MSGCALAAEGNFFASNRRCEAGVQNESHVKLPGTRTPAANLENLLKSSAGRRCRTSTQVWCGTRHYFAVGPGKFTWGLLVRWVLLRLFPLIMSNDSPLQAFSGTDRVTRYPFQFTWFCQRLRLRQCTVPGPWQNSGDTSAAPPFEVHRRSIIV